MAWGVRFSFGVSVGFVLSEIDLIIEENGTLYPIEIKKSDRVTADQTAAFQILDQIGTKKRSPGAMILCKWLPE